MPARRLATLAALEAGLVISAATPSSAAPTSGDGYLTAEAYDAVAAGMTEQQVENVIGTNPQCDSFNSTLKCWTPNAEVDMFATFTFNGKGQLYRKEKNGAFAYAAYTSDKPATMTRSQYDRFAKGDTPAAVNAVIAGTACTDMWVEYPAYPSSAGWRTLIQCTGTVAESYPTIQLTFTDGRLTDKSYQSR